MFATTNKISKALVIIAIFAYPVASRGLAVMMESADKDRGGFVGFEVKTLSGQMVNISSGQLTFESAPNNQWLIAGGYGSQDSKLVAGAGKAEFTVSLGDMGLRTCELKRRNPAENGLTLDSSQPDSSARLAHVFLFAKDTSYLSECGTIGGTDEVWVECGEDGSTTNPRASCRKWKDPRGPI